MNWKSRKEFDYKYELLKDEFNKDISGGTIVVVEKHNKKKIRLEIKTYCLSYRRYKSFDEIPEYYRVYAEKGKCLIKEYPDNSVAVFELSYPGYFKNMYAYIDNQEMLEELNKLQK